MLSKPVGGWTTLNIGELSFTCSYLTNVPKDFINAFIGAIKNRDTVTFTIDGESNGDLLIIMSIPNFYAIECETNKLYDLNDINLYKLMKEFIKDIEKYKDDWGYWLPYPEEPTQYDLSELKKLLKDEIS